MVKNAQIRVETESISTATKNFLNDVFHNIDLGVRAFGVTQKEAMLDPTYGGISRIAPAFQELNQRLTAQSYPHVSDLETLKKAYEDYADFTKSMIEVAKKDSMETFRNMMAEDRGLGLYLKYKDISTKILNFETEEFKKATYEYEAAQVWNMILQVILLLISLPTLGFVIYRIRKDEDTRNKILQELEENNRKYIFNPGTDVGPLQPKEIIECSIENFKKASDFIKKMGSGDYTTYWEGLNEANKGLNENNLAGELMKMKENLVQLKAQDEIRLWANEGLSKFSELVRNNQHDLKKLSDETVRFLAQYLKAQQVGLFVVQNEDQEPTLDLTAAYAFGRKKFLEKSINLGQGLVGQAYLEKSTILLKEIPNGYTTITSGLGEATPTCLILVPIKYNETIEGVLEMASFNTFSDHQISFLEKAGEFIASAMLSVKTSSKMRHLLEESRKQSEESRAQEEIMRQNIEEMEAAQEEIARQNQITQKLLEELQRKEKEKE